MSLTLLTVVLTNLVQVVTMPIVPFMDRAIVSGYIQGRRANDYKLRIEELDPQTNVVLALHGIIHQQQTPKVQEWSVVVVTNAVAVRVVIDGLSGTVVTNLTFNLEIYEPTLRMTRVGDYFYLGWYDPPNGYKLERNDGNGWHPSPTKVKNEGHGVFRLKRNVIWRK